MLGMPMILQMKGFDASVIGLFQIVGLPMVLKFFMSPPVDKFRARKNHYKKWILPVGILYFLLLAYISFLSIEKNISYLFLVALLTSVIANFIDIPLSALAIKAFKKEERIMASGYRMSAYFISLILGGGAFLISYNELGWKITFQIMSWMILFSLWALFFIKENDSVHIEKKAKFKDIILFFKHVDKKWLFLLSTYFMFISAVWVFAKPYFISRGMNPNDVALYVGMYGGAIGAMSGFSMSFFYKFKKKTLLIAFAFLNCLGIFFLIVLYNFLSIAFLLFLIGLLGIGVAFSSALIHAIIMDKARADTKAIDYAVQSSLFSLTRILSAVLAGVIISHFGFKIMFIFELLGMAFIVFWIWKFYETNKADKTLK